MSVISRAQDYMQANGIDAWLLYDFRGSNPVFWQVIGIKKETTRRNFAYIPAKGEARLVVHSLDKLEFGDADWPLTPFVTWQEMDDHLRKMTQGVSKLAMEYSPDGAIPMHSFVDAGMIERIRALGVDVVSSDDLFQVAATAWSERSVELHAEACIIVNEIKDQAFAYIGQALKAGEAVTEYSVKQFCQERFARAGLITNHGPIVGVNEHSGDPHYEPYESNHASIHEGDWVLIDIFAQHNDPEAVYCDITWTGYAGSSVPDKYQKIFDIVTGGRDVAVETLQTAWKEGRQLQGWQVDRVTRDFIDAAGYGEYFSHRTGHSMGVSPTAHALGVNLDDLETHDTRAILPGVGFSVEPGIYLPEFGVRSEIDMHVDPIKGPRVTSSIQREVIRILN